MFPIPFLRCAWFRPAQGTFETPGFILAPVFWWDGPSGRRALGMAIVCGEASIQLDHHLLLLERRTRAARSPARRGAPGEPPGLRVGEEQAGRSPSESRSRNRSIQGRLRARANIRRTARFG